MDDEINTPEHVVNQMKRLHMTDEGISNFIWPEDEDEYCPHGILEGEFCPKCPDGGV
jgi:hypothetical protein